MPFWQHAVDRRAQRRLRHLGDGPLEAGWFFDNAGMDDWGCLWSRTEQENMGQVSACPLADWSDLDRYRPPNPLNPFYYDRLGPLLDKAADRYVVVTAHSLLFSRLHKLAGFANTMQDFYLEPERVHRAFDMIADFKIRQCEELHRRFGSRVDGPLSHRRLGHAARHLHQPKAVRRVLRTSLSADFRRHSRLWLARDPP